MPEFDFSAGFADLDAALAGGVQQTPFITQMHEFAMRQPGHSGQRFYRDAEVFVRGVLDTARRFEFDVPTHGWDVYNVEAEALG